MSRRVGRRTTGALAILAAATVVSCIREVPAAPTSTASRSPVRRALAIYAPAPLEEAFEEIAGDFEFAHEDVDVSLTFGPSADLAERFEGAEMPDVFVSESEASLDAAAASPGLDTPTPFARNELVVILPVGNPEGIDAFSDLGEPTVDLVLVAADAAGGEETRVALASGGILVDALRNVVIEAPDVATVVATIATGAADAGIAYGSYVSVAADNDLPFVSIPDGVNVETVYSIAVLATSREQELARDFIGWLSTAGGSAVLEDYGFETID